MPFLSISVFPLASTAPQAGVTISAMLSAQYALQNQWSHFILMQIDKIIIVIYCRGKCKVLTQVTNRGQALMKKSNEESKLEQQDNFLSVSSW